MINGDKDSVKNRNKRGKLIIALLVLLDGIDRCASKCNNFASMESMDNHHHESQVVDKIGLGLSFLCMIHCVFLPVIIVFLPALDFMGEESATHLFLACTVLVVSVYSFSKGYRLHRDLVVPVLGGIGTAGLFVALALPEGVWFGLFSYESVATTLGGIFLVAAHLRNLHEGSCSRCKSEAHHNLTHSNPPAYDIC